MLITNYLSVTNKNLNQNYLKLRLIIELSEYSSITNIKKATLLLNIQLYYRVRPDFMDRQVVSLSSILLLFFHTSFSKLIRNLVVEFCMPAKTILKHLNILKRDALGIFSDSEFIVMQAFILQCAKEAFHWCVIPAIAFTAHGVLHLVVLL